MSKSVLEWQVLELYNDVLRKISGKNKVLVIDLARELPKDTLYIYDRCHYTNLGAEKVAALIEKHLTPYLAKKYRAYFLK